MKKFVLRTVLFGLLLFLSFRIMETSLPFYWGNKGMITKFNYYNDHKKEFNTVFIGSSRTYRHVDPISFDSATLGKTKSFNLAMAAMYNPEMYYIYENILDRGGINFKYAFLELQKISDLDAKNVHTTNARYNLTWPMYWFVSEHFWRSSIYEPDERDKLFSNYTLAFAEKQLGVGLIKNMIDYWSLAPLANRRYYLGPNDLGFASLDFDVANFQTSKDNKAARQKNLARSQGELKKKAGIARELYAKDLGKQADRTHLGKLMELIERSKEQGVTLIYIFPPRAQSEHMFALYQALPDENKIDMGDPDLNPEFYSKAFSFDLAHLNEKGAILYTKRLADSFLGLEKKKPSR